MKKESIIIQNLEKVRNQRGLYYKRVFASIMGGLVVVICILSTLMITFGYRQIKTYNQRIDSIITEELDSRMQSLYDDASQISNKLFANLDVKLLMYGKEPQNGNELYEAYKNISKTQNSLIGIEDMVQSFVVYSSRAGRTYSSKDGLNYKDTWLIETNEFEDGNPVFRRKEGPKGTTDVLTFASVERNADDSINCGVFVNIYASIVEDTIEKIIETHGLYGNAVIVFDDKMNPIITAGSDEMVTEKLLSAIKEKHKNSDSSFDNVFRYSGATYYLSPISLDKPDWYVFRIQPRSIADQDMRYYLILSLISVVLCIVMATILARYITGMIYKPVEALTKKIQNSDDENDRLTQENEIALLNQTYDSIGTIREALLDSKKKILLYDMFNRASSESGDSYDGDSVSFKVDMNIPMTMLIIKIDDGEVFYDQSSYIEKLADEAVKSFDNEMVRLDILTMACIVQTRTQEHRNMLMNQLENCCETVLTWQSYVICVSELFSGRENIHKAYRTVQNGLKRRFFVGDRAVISPDTVEKEYSNVWASHSDVFTEEDNLINAIRDGKDRIEIEKRVSSYVGTFDRYQYSDFGVFRSHLINSIQNLLDSINKIRTVSVRLDPWDIDEKMLLCNNTSQLKTILLDDLSELSNELRTDKEDKYSELVQLIIEIVHKEYGNPELCLMSISDRVNMSQNYVGRLFKSRMGVSVSAYITDVRLDEAAKLIRENNIKITMILTKVGFTNQSSFYKCFKQKFMVTPKDYALKYRKDNTNGII